MGLYYMLVNCIGTKSQGVDGQQYWTPFGSSWSKSAHAQIVIRLTVRWNPALQYFCPFPFSTSTQANTQVRLGVSTADPSSGATIREERYEFLSLFILWIR